MNRLHNYSRLAGTIALIFSAVAFAARCMQETKQPVIIRNSAGAVFAGSESCAGCHRDILDKHKNTAHYLTLKPASQQFIKGSFETGLNSYPYDNEHVVVMEKRDSSFYQVQYTNGQEVAAHRMDMVIGSGTMGQSFLSWKDDRLYQMPITFFTAANAWSNSPGYPHKIIFDRPITSRCLECHTTFAKTISLPNVEPEKFAANQFIYGVDCEKCHGPAAEHVNYQQQHPQDTIAKHIINPAKLSRQQNLDLCASCHGGRLQKTKPSFEFTVGNALADYYVPDTTTPNPDKIDVHGNQYGLLRASKCFRMSETLTCNTCHNSHENEKGKTALFSQRCMSCHNTEHKNFCIMADAIGPKIKNNCIDCHMPLKPSRAITVQLSEANTAASALIRSHFITIYPDESQRLIEFIKKQ